MDMHMNNENEVLDLEVLESRLEMESAAGVTAAAISPICICPF